MKKSEAASCSHCDHTSHQARPLLFVQAGVAGLAGLFLMGFAASHGLAGEVSLLQQLIWVGLGFGTLGVLWFSAADIYRGALASFKTHHFNMYTLIALGTGVAWLFSMVVVLFPSSFPSDYRSVYFESALMIIAFVQLGAGLEAKTQSRTNRAIQALLALTPPTARVVRDGVESDIPLAAVQMDDVIRLRPGDKIPVDGVVVSGESTVDQSMLTGEPMPVVVHEHDKVTAGTINVSGTLLCRATGIGANTTVARIVEMVKRAESTKPALARLADRISSVFVPVVIGIAVMTGFVWWWMGPAPQLAYMTITMASVLLIACPCALGLAVPLAVMAGVGKAAEFGMLIREGDALQSVGQLTTVVFDKTGTLTVGKPQVVGVVPSAYLTEAILLRYAASVEQGSAHPIAAALVAAAKAEDVMLSSVSQFKSWPGLGVEAVVEGHHIRLGNEKWMKHAGLSFDGFVAKAQAGVTRVMVSVDDEPAGVIAIADTLRPEAAFVIESIKALGMKTVLLSGDHVSTAKEVGQALGMDEVIADVLPAEKAVVIQRLQASGERVGMVGDGINDAPALATANVGIAMGAGTDIAIESADLILLGHSLRGLLNAVTVSRATVRTIKQNFFGALLYNGLAIPVAAGVLYPWFGMLLNPMWAGAAMALSSLTVVLNASRLRRLSLTR